MKSNLFQKFGKFGKPEDFGTLDDNM